MLQVFYNWVVRKIPHCLLVHYESYDLNPKNIKFLTQLCTAAMQKAGSKSNMDKGINLKKGMYHIISREYKY